MIDTIKIRLPLKSGPYNNNELFYPFPLSNIRNFSTNPYTSTLFNPGKTLSKGTQYTPTYIGEKILAGDGSGVGYYLSVEVSLPKLMFGNNVDELSTGEESLKRIMSRLRKVIYRDIGLRYSESEIASSMVSKIHIGKNFMFDDPGAPTIITNMISKSRADRIQDDHKTRYENGSYSFKTHTNMTETIVYDKKSDLRQSSKSLKRAIDGTITEGIDEEESSIGELLADKFTGVFRNLITQAVYARLYPKSLVNSPLRMYF